MKRTVLLLGAFVAALSGGTLSGQENHSAKLNYQESPKFTRGYHNPLLDFMFVADPTSVEHEGRLYVYGTNDTQQLDSVGPKGKNGYQYIHSLAMLSTDDMVNWTYHGLIDVARISPWGMASWAPTVISRKEEDGKTHFYIYYSNSGTGVGVLTATSPVGPWSDPLGHAIVWQQMPGLGHCPAPFDPGAVIDEHGTGWLAFGGGGKGEHGSEYMPGVARIVRLGKDLISLDSEMVEIKAPYHFEANELNYINGTWIYTYNTSWVDRTEWPYKDIEKPSQCCMSYMTSHTPLVTDSWKYQKEYFKNPGNYGWDFCNNHTHLQKFQGEYYLLYHGMPLQKYKGTEGGFRSVCINKLKVDEQKPELFMGQATLEGVEQIKPLNPYITQQAETTAATLGVDFEATDQPGNMVATGRTDEASAILVRGVDFSSQPKTFAARAQGKGTLEVHLNKPDGPLVATVSFDDGAMTMRSVPTNTVQKGKYDLCFVFEGNGLKFDEWRFGH